MDHLEVPQFLGILALMLASARLLGSLAQKTALPAVLGELVAGVLLGSSVAGVVDPSNGFLHLFAELGVVILLFDIGLETDLRQLLKAGGASTAVATVGVLLPFLLGYGVCRSLGLSSLVGLVAGATLTATSIGITARVLSDLHRLQEPESQVILGAAVIDDVIGLIILAVVTGITEGQAVSALGIAKIAGLAIGFIAATLLLGSFLVPVAVAWARRSSLPGTLTTLAVVLALGFAWLADQAGSGLIIGSFAAGLLLRATPEAKSIHNGVAHLAHFFVPLFFVAVGAAVDVRILNPFDPANRQTLLAGGLLIVAAIVGKFLAGYAPFWFKGNKKVIGVGMIPRGEVGLIFAQIGLDREVFDAGLFSAVTIMVMVTTFIAPIALRALLPPPDERETTGAGKMKGE
jgi:Kef-type K+ transport system membrane component KefB